MASAYGDAGEIGQAPTGPMQRHSKVGFAHMNGECTNQYDKVS
jgi:hypothetical protein